MQQRIDVRRRPELTIDTVTQMILSFGERSLRNSRVSGEVWVSIVTKAFCKVRRRRRRRLHDLLAESPITPCVTPIKKRVHSFLQFIREFPCIEFLESSHTHD